MPKTILAVNSYLEGREADCKSGLYSRAHLWGFWDLRDAGYNVKLFPGIPQSERSGLVAGFSQLTRGYFGDVGGALSLIRASRSADAIYVASGEMPLLMLARKAGWVRAKVAKWAYAPSPRRVNPGSRRLTLAMPPWTGADGLFCLTPITEQASRESNPRRLARFIDWGVDLEMFQPCPVGEVSDYALSVGRNERDFGTLVAASGGLGMTVQLVAPSSSLSGMDLPPEVLHIGGPANPGDDRGLPYPELIQRMQRARCIVIALRDDPTTGNGYTNLLESLAVGRPVVMTRTGALAIDLEKEGAGRYASPGNPRELAAAIRWFHDHPSEADEMGRRARRLAESRFDLAGFGKRVVSLFHELIGPP